jgi:hypothetical protein
MVWQNKYVAIMLQKHERVWWKVYSNKFLITKIMCRVTDRIMKGFYFLKWITCKLCKVWSSHSGGGEFPNLLGHYAVLPGKQWLTCKRSVLQSKAWTVLPWRWRHFAFSKSATVYQLTQCNIAEDLDVFE